MAIMRQLKRKAAETGYKRKGEKREKKKEGKLATGLRGTAKYKLPAREKGPIY